MTVRVHRIRLVLGVAAAMLIGCGGKATPAPTVGNAGAGSDLAGPAAGDAGAAFAATAAAAGFAFTTPAGYRPTPIVDNVDVSYGHALVSDDGGIELRYALRPYPSDLPPAMRTRQFSDTFFATALLNLTRGGQTGDVPDDSEALSPADFAADDASLTIVHWRSTDGDPDAFATGFAAAAVLYIHKDGLGDGYLFIMLRDLDALEHWDQAALRSLRFAAR